MVQEFWRVFLRDSGRDPAARYYEVFAFGPTPAIQDRLIELTLSGRKRATTSSYPAYAAEGQDLPTPGELSIVLDGRGEPRCVIETTKLTILPFRDVTFDLCAREGEDERIETWRQTHFQLFAEEAKALGFVFDESSAVVFEDFRVVYTGK